MKLDCHFSLITNINSRWLNDLNVRLETMKLLEENESGNTSGYWSDRFFYGTIPTKAQETKEKGHISNQKSAREITE